MCAQSLSAQAGAKNGLRWASVPGLCRAASILGQGQDLNPDFSEVEVQNDPRNVKMSVPTSRINDLLTNPPTAMLDRWRRKPKMRKCCPTDLREGCGPRPAFGGGEEDEEGARELKGNGNDKPTSGWEQSVARVCMIQVSGMQVG
jgi:hypothetical protein